LSAVYWAFTLAVAFFLILFAVSNRQTAALGLWPLPFVVDLPLYLLVLASMLAGFIVGAAIAWIAARNTRRELRRYRRRIVALEREIAATQAQLENHAAMATPAPSAAFRGGEVPH
jgi:lipopolysaccharide assembly protein A